MSGSLQLHRLKVAPLAVVPGSHGVSPFFGILIGGAFATIVGLAIGYLPFRWQLGKLTFALLTLAVSYAFEFTVGAVPALGRNNGLFLQSGGTGFWDFGSRDPGWPLAIFAVLASALAVSIHFLLSHRIGFFWRAIRLAVSGAPM